MATLDKNKAKSLLFALEENKGSLTPFELAELTKKYEKFDASMQIVQRSIGSLQAMVLGTARNGEAVRAVASIVKNFDEVRAQTDAIRDLHEKQTKILVSSITSSLADLKDNMIISLGKLENSSVASEINAHAGPLFKTMINEISGVNKQISTWKFPQYSAVSVRNKNFANINPATDDKGISVGNGTVTVTTGGTAVHLSATSVPCTRVVITAHESNTNSITIGGSTVVAALLGRKGVTLYPTNNFEFKVSDLNLLYVDSITNGDKVSYYYEAA